jgi:hypothetical protein
MKKSRLREEFEQKHAKIAKKKCCGICMRRVLRIKIPQRVLKESWALRKSLHPGLLFNSRKPRFAIFDGWRISPDTKTAKHLFLSSRSSRASVHNSYLDFFHFLN